MRELQPLNEAECQAMLRGTHVGRIAISTPQGPHVAPVRFTVIDLGGRPVVVIRTTPHSLLSSQSLQGSLTLEIDELDEERDSGWTVSARGRCEPVRDEREREAVEAAWPSSSVTAGPASGAHSVLVKLPWSELTGRRLGPDRALPVAAR